MGKKMLSEKIKLIESLVAVSTSVENPGFTKNRISRYLVAYDQCLPQPLSLIADSIAFIDSWVGQNHKSGHNAPSREVSCYFCKDIQVSGRGHLFIDDALVISDEIVPDYWRNIILKTNDIDIDKEHNLPLQTIEEPTLIICGHGIEVYGHFLIETLPKLMVARHALNEKFYTIKILLPTFTPSWLKKILTNIFKIKESQFLFYHSHHDRVMVREAVVPTLVSFDGWFHPHFNSIIDEITRLVGIEAESINVPRVFLSRALHSSSQSGGRRCLNEHRLSEIAVSEFEFAVVPAETFPWPTQIGIFRNARIIVGEFGSGLHTAIFSRPGTIVGSLGIRSLAQTMIGAVRQQHNAYLRIEWDEDNTCVIDEDIFRKFMKVLVSELNS